MQCFVSLFLVVSTGAIDCLERLPLLCVECDVKLHLLVLKLPTLCCFSHAGNGVGIPVACCSLQCRYGFFL